MPQGYGIGGALQAAGGAMVNVASQMAEMRKLEEEQKYRQMQAQNIQRQIEQQEIENSRDFEKNAEAEYLNIYTNVGQEAADEYIKNINEPLTAAISKTRRLAPEAAAAVAKHFSRVARRNLGINLIPRVKRGMATPAEAVSAGQFAKGSQEYLASSGLPGAESAGVGPVGEQAARPGAVHGQTFIQSEFINPEIVRERVDTIKDQTDYARKLVELNQVDSLKEGLQYAKALSEYQSGKRTSRPELVIKTDRPVQIDPQTQQSIAQSQDQIRAALPEPEGLIGQRLVKRRQLSDDAIKRLGGIKNYSDGLLKNTMPRFIEIQKKLGGTNLVTGSIEKIINKAGLSNEESAALMSVIGQTGFDKIKTDSGAAFTETELKMRFNQLPKITDTLDQAMGKIAALAALNMTDAANSLEALKAGGYDVRAARDMLGINAIGPKERARVLLEALPDNVTTSAKQLTSFIEGLDPETKQEFIVLLESMKKK